MLKLILVARGGLVDVLEMWNLCIYDSRVIIFEAFHLKGRGSRRSRELRHFIMIII